QPLLCTSLLALLALLLLPPALSCDSQRPPKEVSDDYMAILQTHLTNTVSKTPIEILSYPAAIASSSLHLKGLILTEPPVGALKRKRKATRQTSEDKKKNKREKKLCKAMEILSNMTECYQMLNALLAS
uniref:Uncharacterized protein n=1 Tax=Labrus bergylta TaxID=56723 RepID=A0A3Q3GKU3_9LABR